MDEVTDTFTRTRARVEIDINAQTADGCVRTRAINASRPVVIGETVTAYEPEDGIIWHAIVERIDNSLDMVYLTVDWASVADDNEAPIPSVKAQPTSKVPSARTESSWQAPVRLRQSRNFSSRIVKTAPSSGGMYRAVANASSGSMVRAMKGPVIR